jgi:hypothetical protein
MMKNHRNGQGARAREAIRYLEQRLKYPSPYLVGQKPSEYRNPWESTDINGTLLAQEIGPIVGCWLYFAEYLRDNEFGVAVVTNCEEVMEISQSINMPAISAAAWTKTLLTSRNSKNNSYKY